MRLTAAACAFCLLSACSGGTAPQIGPNISGHAAHSVADRQLRGLMGELNSLMLSEKEMTEHEREVKRREYQLKLVATAEVMAHTVDAILSRLPALNLGAEEQDAFRAVAALLRHDIRGFQEMARGYYGNGLAAQLDRMEATCAACHRLFGPGGS